MTEAQKILTHLKDADDKDIKRLSMVLGLQNAQGQNIDGISRIMSIPIEFCEPGGTLRSLFMKGICEYRLGNLDNAVELLSNVVQVAVFDDDGTYEKAAALFMEGKKNNYSNEQIRQVIALLYPSVCDKVMSDLADPKTALEKIYPVCNGFDCKNCDIADKCKYPKVREVARKNWELLNAYAPAEEEICRTFAR